MLKEGSIRYFRRKSESDLFVPGVVVGVKNNDIYRVIFYDGSIVDLIYSEIEYKTSQGLEPMLREVLTQLCNAYIKMEKTEREYKLANLNFLTMCEKVQGYSKKWEDKWGW